MSKRKRYLVAFAAGRADRHGQSLLSHFMQAVVEATGEKPMPVMKGAYEDMVIVSVETSASADVLFDAIRKRLNPEIDLARANFPDNLFVTETADEGVGTEHLVVTAFRAAN